MENQQISEPATPKVGPKYVFLHLFAILALYFTAASFLALIFQYANVLFPDPLEQGGYYLESAYSGIRFAISALIVVFPAYLLTMRYLNKVYLENQGVRTLRTRKWLTYFTLFAAAIIMAGDLVAVVNRLLGGELTARFILKVAAVLLVAGSVFYYYYFDLKKYKTE